MISLRPFDTSIPGGRSKERNRRAALTSVSSIATKAIGALTLLASVPLTLRYLGPERYGLWMVLTSIISVMSFADLGIGNGLMNAVSEAYGKDDRRLAKECVSSGFFLMLGISAVFFITGAAAYPFVPWPRLFNVKSAAVAAEGARAFVVLFSWFVLNIPLGLITRVQAALQQGYWAQVLGAIGNVLSLLALLLVIALHGSLAWLVFASTVGVIIATLLNAGLLLREHAWLLPSWNSYKAGSATHLLRLSLMFFVLQCAVAIGYTSDNIVITQIAGASAVAVYAVPQKLFGLVSLLVSVGVTPLWPAYGEALARGDVGWIRKVFWSSSRITLWIAVPLCTLLLLTGPWILTLVAGKSLHVPISLLIALACGAVISAASAPTSILLNGTGVLKAQTVIAVVASVTNLVLSVAFTRQLGVVGVCLGSILTQVLIVFPAYFLVVRQLFKKLSRQSIGSESSCQLMGETAA